MQLVFLLQMRKSNYDTNALSKTTLQMFEDQFKKAARNLGYSITQDSFDNIMQNTKADILHFLSAKNNREKLQKATYIFQSTYNMKEELESGKVRCRNVCVLSYVSVVKKSYDGIIKYI